MSDTSSMNVINSENAPRNIPRDSFSIVYLIFTLLGMGVLIPWNFFITATDYFTTKLNDSAECPTRQQLITSFPNSQTMAAMIPFAIFNVLNLFLTNLCKPSARFHIGNTMIFICFIVTISLVEVQLPCQAFFATTLILVVFINIGCAILQGATLGILSFLPPKHVGGYLEGQALAGILSSVANLVVISASSDKMASATAFFAIALAFIAMATALFLLLPRNPHFAHFFEKPYSQLVSPENVHERTTLKLSAESEVKLNPRMTEGGNEGERSLSPEQPAAESKKLSFAELLQSLKEPGAMGFVAFFTLFTTLALFPTLFIRIQLSSEEPWKVKYYIPIFVFLLFNICDYISRKFAVLAKWPRENQPKLLVAMCISRLLLVIAVMFANQAGKMRFAVLFASDIFVPVFILLLGLSNGFLLTLAFMYAPNYASPGKEEQVGVAMGLYVALGLAMGVAVSFPLNLLL